ncbi:MAG: ATP-binding response regulator, partial [Actinomycetota bacterium]
MAVTAPDGRLLQVNRALCKMLGYSRDKLLGRRLDELTASENRVISLETGEQGLGNGTVEDTVTPLSSNEGHVVWARMNACLMRDESGDPLYSVTQIEDITEKLRLEQQLLQTQKMEAIGRIAGGVAHDFNNLLFVIKNHVGFTMDQMARSAPARADLEQVLEAADRAEALVRQLLAFSRKSVAQPRIVDLNQLVHEMKDIVRSAVGAEVSLVFDIAESVPTTRADPGHLKQVLMNLVLNARDAMPEGGTLTIETSVRDVDNDFAELHPGMKRGGYALLRVSDTGVGMEPKLAAQVFEPFFTTKPRGAGTGLGLATVYGIVKQANGYVSVRSAPRQGATFEVYLPLCDAQTAIPSGSDRPGARPHGVRQVVLVVDDEAGVRRLVKRILSAAGYEVLEATSGGHALELVAESGIRIEALVTDVVMPGINGKELADELARRFPGLT